MDAKALVRRRRHFPGLAGSLERGGLVVIGKSVIVARRSIDEAVEIVRALFPSAALAAYITR